MESLQNPEQRAEHYAKLYGLLLLEQLGFGNDGVVWNTTTGTVVKAVYRQDTFERERDTYLRLFEAGVRELAGFCVPE